jgi:tetratricopeptide (TPR) repeat protein
MKRHLSRITLMALLVQACSHTPEEPTLADWDTSGGAAPEINATVPRKTEEEIKQAYYQFIQNADARDRSRLVAINRLAEMEIEKAKAALQASARSDEPDDDIYLQSLSRTRDLLKTSLKDYPDAPNSDQVLYRLAHIEDQLGNHQESLAALVQLAQAYPESAHYAETQFRLGERAFLKGDYIAAEDAYTEVIYALNNADYKQRALFKRGWSRYKQGLYAEAAEDHYRAIEHQNFPTYAELSDNERGIFEEHFRAIALAFIHIPNQDFLFQFFPDAENDYLYHTCRAMSEIFLQQERFNDAAQVLRSFVERKRTSQHAPMAHLRVLDIWKTAGFATRRLNELTDFYAFHGSNKEFWQAEHLFTIQDEAWRLREHFLYAASHHHKAFKKAASEATADSAARWYERYIRHFPSAARSERVYTLYGDLLTTLQRKEEAIGYYEQAAYDGNIILDKQAAYATVTLSFEMYKAQQADATTAEQWLDKHLRYAQQFVSLYPDSLDASDIALHAAEAAYKHARFADTIALANLLPQDPGSRSYASGQLLKARSLFELDRLVEAEETLTLLARNGTHTRSKAQTIADNLALVIFRRGEYAQQQGEIQEAIIHFARITDAAPASDVAPQALYDAIDLAIAHELWHAAIQHMEFFQAHYGSHALADDVTRRLSVAYLNAKQYVAAAKALETVSSQAGNDDVKMASLWQAAELYEQEGNAEAAVRTYRTYAHTYPRPYPQYMEAMYKLTQLYDAQNDEYRRNFWFQKIADAERSAPASIKTDRTNHIGATSLLNLARQKQSAFQHVRLVEPLAESLARKKTLMQEAIELYSQASSYNQAGTTTEATFSIASTYQSFSRALLDSERPGHLTGAQLAQYEILLEDQAFPFEEMSIEFHEANLAKIAQGIVTPWVDKSIKQLQTLFPVRYARTPKLEAFKGELQP